MAKTRATALDMPDETDSDAEEMADLNAAEDGDLFKAIDDIRGTSGAKVRIVKIQPNDGHCEDMDVAEWSLETLRGRWGPGTYKLRIVGPKGFLPGGGTIKIAPTLNKSSGTSDITSFLQMMEQRDAERRKEADARWSRIIELSIPAGTTLLAAILGRSQGPDIATLITALKPAPGPTIGDLTGALANIKQLSGGDDKETSLDQILKVMDAVKDFSDSGDSGGKGASNWIDLVRDLIKVAPDALKPVLEARMAAMQNAGAPTVRASVQPVIKPVAAPATSATASVAPVVQPSAGVAEASSQANTGDNNMMLAIFIPIIKEKLHTIANWATSDRDPVMYAQVLCDEVGETLAKYLPQAQALEYLNHPDWFKFVCEWESSLSSYKQWCEDFRNELIEIVSIGLEDAASSENSAEPPDPTADHPPVKPT